VFWTVYPTDPLLGDVAHVAECGAAWLFPDVEPLLVPFGERCVLGAAEVLVLHPVTQIEVFSTCNLGASNCSFLPQKEKITKEIEVRLCSNIGLAQMDECGDKKNRVRVQIANPDLIVEKKTLEKRMDGNPKTPFKEIFEDYNLTGAGVGVALPLWCPPSSELLTVQESLFDEVVDGPCVALGFLPFLGHHLGPLLGIALHHFNSSKVSSLVLRLEGAEKDGGWAIEYDCRLKNKDTTLGFYNNSLASTTSRILGKWADLAAAAAFRFFIIIAVNMVVFLHN